MSKTKLTNITSVLAKKQKKTLSNLAEIQCGFIHLVQVNNAVKIKFFQILFF